MSFIVSLPKFVDGVLSLRYLERLTRDPVQAFGGYQVLVAQYRLELSGIHFRHEYFIEAAEKFAQIARHRPQLAKMDVRHGESPFPDLLDSPADRTVSRAPADDRRLSGFAAPLELLQWDIAGDPLDLFLTDHRHFVMVARII